MDTDEPSRPLLRIGIVFADELRIEGLREALTSVAELIPMTAPETLREDKLSMVLIDGREDDLFTLMAAFRRARPGLRLIVLGTRNEPRYIQQVVASGAKGYLLHTAHPKEIIMAVEVVADGSIWAPRKVLASLIDTYSPAEPRRRGVQLTGREQQVIDLLIAGRSNAEIGRSLGIEVKTVKVYVGRLLQKLSVPNRVALTVRALELHLGSESQM